MSGERKCGCKGIRTCLLCEQQRDSYSDPHKIKEVINVYTYCPQCNLCWPDSDETACQYDFPLYLGKLKLYPDFFSEDQETDAITSIDKIPWMPSQSGRRKQDFGPKVNFKKKKVKIGEFKGFPRFTESILRKLQAVSELSDFEPVELCHLEYSPERGSSIDPHVDDFWLWGERLVTINLGSSTVMTLVPCSIDGCECYQETNPDFCHPCNLFKEKHSDMKYFSCNHKFRDTYSTEGSLRSMSINDNNSAKNSNNFPDGFEKDIKNSKLLSVDSEHYSFSSTQALKNNSSGDIPCPADQLNSEKRACNMPLEDNENSLFSGTKSTSEIPDSEVNGSVKTSSVIGEQKAGKAVNFDTSQSSCICDFHSTKCTISNTKTLCNVFRTVASDFKVAIRIVLPPRSLLVLAGCARYNWYHEIKRQDVVSRRLAMTFRELTAEFLDGGTESLLGKQILQIANNFFDL